MTSQFKKTLILALSLLGLILIGVMFSRLWMKKAEAPQMGGNEKMSNPNEDQLNLPAPSGKVDDAIDSAVSGISAESNILKDEDSAASGALDDSSEASSFGRSNQDDNL